MEKSALTHFPVVIIGGSAGSLDVLLRLLPAMQAVRRYALVIVLHRKKGDDATLEELLEMKCATPVQVVEDKTGLRPGFIYVAPADYHLLFEKDNLLSLDTSEKINYSRPSIDVAMESAADAFGPSLTGILLSGANADGTAGLVAVENAGGTVLIQLPETAEMPFMPESAAQQSQTAKLMNVAGIRQYLADLDDLDE